MRRVCCMIDCWESGGIESFLYNLLMRTDLTQMQVDIVASCLGESVFTKPLQELGICFFELSGNPRSVLENHRRFRLLIRERRWDVLHLNAFHGVSLAYLRIARQEGVPIRVAHSHNSDIRKSLTRPLKLALHAWAKERYTRDATELWACSRSAAEFLFPKGQRYQWIPDGIETERFRFQLPAREIKRNALGLEKDTLLIGTVGRLSEMKNHRFLLKVLYELKKMRKNSALVIVGTGHLERQLRMQARKLCVEEDVIFYGASAHVEQLLWAMDVFVFPSRFEGLGIAAVEAQTAGLPVLCSKSIPPEAIVTDQTVQLALSAGPKAWAEMALKIRVKGRETGVKAVAAAGFDIQAVAERIKEKWIGGDVVE